jgi:hypothetical protein
LFLFDGNRGIDDTTLLLGDLSGKNRLLHATPQEVKGVVELSDGQVEEESANQGYIWRSYMDMNYELNKAALATQFNDIYALYSDMSEVEADRQLANNRSSVPDFCFHFTILNRLSI